MGSVGENWLNVYFLAALRSAHCCLYFFNVAFRRVYDRKWSIRGLNVLQTADHKCTILLFEAVCLGITANLMVCLAVWMSYSGRSLMDKAFIMVLPVAICFASGLGTVSQTCL
ncbi:hypothetical protein DMI62_06600 [Escherichia coli]|nr:hypothetical protein [Escherichia coli]